MKLIKKIIISFCAIFLFSQLSMAQMVHTYGTGSCELEKARRSSTPSSEEQAFALERAKEDALSAYASYLSSSEKALFEKQKRQFFYNINDFVKNVKITRTRVDKLANIYYIDITANIDEGKIKDEFRKSYNNSVASEGVSSQSGGYVLFFACRRVSEHTAFDEKVTKINKSTNAKSFSQGVDDDGVSLTASESMEKMDTTQRGGSTTRKSDAETLVSDESVAGEFSAALTGNILDMISDAYVVDGAFFDSNAMFQSLYGEGKAMNASTWRSIMAETREDEDIKYAILGTLTFSAKMIDTRTGVDSQEATVTAAIYDISKKSPRMIISLEPITLKGVGSTQSAAQKAALLRSASEGAKEIVSKLMLKLSK